MASLLRACRKALTSTATAQPLLRRGYAVESAAAIRESPDRVKWDYRGQRRIIPLGQWLPKIAVDAYVAPNVVLAGQVTVGDGSSVWNGSVLRGDLNKITIGFCCNIQERCVIHAAWNSPTGGPAPYCLLCLIRSFLCPNLAENKKGPAEDGLGICYS
ncbi:Gamma carbonic anhydrase-like 1, mitochondrial [Vitis vinifera]|uniref:Gamma carbonic anhydrase-like 1, mitochondrial n=1 Tax=Vitis vinifera TaxID=29760 RepID=A0A438KAA1_VITVI|nr:Gamma carbonic anhydrase-like 1, mitochondrial [Vitis vinifera]